jgi:hypothetical protein
MSSPRTRKPEPKSSNEIRLKITCLLASRFDKSELDVTNTECYALVWKEVLFSFVDMPPSLPPAIVNGLQEFVYVFPQSVPPGLPPIHGCNIPDFHY